MHYYQHHIGDFIRDTANLSDSQTMAYLRLIWMYYDSEEPLKNDPESLAFSIGSDDATVLRLLKHYFVLDADAWRHKRIDAEISAYHSKAEKARESAKARWKNKKSMPPHSDGNANAYRPDDSSLNIDANQEPRTTLPPTVEREGDAQPPEGKAVASAGTRLSSDWVLPIEWGNWAISEGLTEAQVRSSADTFRDHWVAKAGKDARKADWLATWRNWVRRDLNRVGGSYGSASHEKRRSGSESIQDRVKRDIAERNARRSAAGAGAPVGETIDGEFERVPF